MGPKDGADESKMAVFFRSNGRTCLMSLKMAVKIDPFHYSGIQVKKYSLTGIDAVLK